MRTALLLLICSPLVSCQTETIEHRHVPAWHLAMGKELPKNSSKDGNTKVVYSTLGGSNSNAVQEYLNSVELEAKDEETGEVTLKAVLPEQLLSQALVCLRDRNWHVLYGQVLSTGAQRYFKGVDEELTYFESYFDTNRLEIAKTMRKMMQSRTFGDTLVHQEGNRIVMYFSPNMLGDFQFKRIEFVKEGELVKLDSIQ